MFWKSTTPDIHPRGLLLDVRAVVALVCFLHAFFRALEVRELARNLLLDPFCLLECGSRFRAEHRDFHLLLRGGLHRVRQLFPFRYVSGDIVRRAGHLMDRARGGVRDASCRRAHGGRARVCFRRLRRRRGSCRDACSAGGRADAGGDVRSHIWRRGGAGLLSDLPRLRGGGLRTLHDSRRARDGRSSTGHSLRLTRCPLGLRDDSGAGHFRDGRRRNRRHLTRGFLRLRDDPGRLRYRGDGRPRSRRLRDRCRRLRCARSLCRGRSTLRSSWSLRLPRRRGSLRCPCSRSLRRGLRCPCSRSLSCSSLWCARGGWLRCTSRLLRLPCSGFTLCTRPFGAFLFLRRLLASRGLRRRLLTLLRGCAGASRRARCRLLRGLRVAGVLLRLRQRRFRLLHRLGGLLARLLRLGRDLLLVLLDRLPRLAGSLAPLVAGALELGKCLVDLLPQLRHARDQILEGPPVLLGLVVRRLRLPVSARDLIEGPARLRHLDPGALVDRYAALLDALRERALHLLAHLMELPVLVLEPGEKLLRLLLVLVLVLVVAARERVVVRLCSLAAHVGLSHRCVLHFFRRAHALLHAAGA